MRTVRENAFGVGIHEQPATLPPTTGWSWVNQGSTVEALQSDGTLLFAVPATASNNLVLRLRPVSTNTKYRARLAHSYGGANGGAGFGFRESSSGNIRVLYVKVSTAVTETWTNATTYSTGNTITRHLQGTGWWEMEWDGSQMIWRYSYSGYDNSFVEWDTRTTFTPDQVGVVFRDNNAAINGALSSWQEI